MTTSASTIFSQLGAIAGNDLFTTVIPVLSSAVADIEANPSEWTNPVTVIIKADALRANLTATLPTLENTAVTQAAQLISALVAAVQAKIAAAAGGVTPASIAAEIAGSSNSGGVAGIAAS